MDLGKLNAKLNERFLNTLNILLFNIETYEDLFKENENDPEIKKISKKLSNLSRDSDFISYFLIDFLFPESTDKNTSWNLDYNRSKKLLPYIAEEMEADGLTLEDVEVTDYLPTIRASIDIDPALSLEEIRECFSIGPFDNCLLNAIKTYYKKDGFPENLFFELEIIDLLEAINCYEAGTLDTFIKGLRAAPAPSRLPVKHQLLPTDRLWRLMQIPGILLTPEERAKSGEGFQYTKCNDGNPEDRVLFTLNDDTNIKISDHFTAFEMACLSAVFSELNVGNNVFSIDDIARGAYALPAKNTINEPTRNEIRQIMQKFSNTTAEIDFTKGIVEKNYIDKDGEKIESFARVGRILDYEIVQLKTNRGTVKSFYWIRSTPAIYEYLTITKRVASVPRKVLDVRILNPDGSIGTRAGLKADRGVPILYALAGRLSFMKREAENAQKTYRKQFDRNGTPRKEADQIKTAIQIWENSTAINAPYRIKTRSIVEAAGLEISGTPGTQRKKEKDMRNVIESILDYWVACEYIDGYRKAKQGQAIIGYDIIFNGIND